MQGGHNTNHISLMFLGFCESLSTYYSSYRGVHAWCNVCVRMPQIVQLIPHPQHTLNHAVLCSILKLKVGTEGGVTSVRVIE